MSYIGNPIISTDFPKDTFSGNGATVAFTMSIAPASVNAVIVVVSGITQDPSTYTISGTTLTFSAAPPSGTDNISVRHLGVAGIPNVPSAGSVVTTSIADANITQAKLASGVAGTGPAFSAYANAAQSVANNTEVKIQFNTEEFDTNSCFDTSNYRFTPTVAGYYQLNSYVLFDSNITSGYVFTNLYKNGSIYKRAGQQQANYWSTECSCVVYANGTTDYFEIYVVQNSGATTTTEPSATGRYTWFNGSMIRAA